MANTAGGIAVGMILQWSGAEAGIPAGFRLCDGYEGSPDLRDKFIIGAGGTYSPDATGGGATHTHSVSGGGGGGPTGTGTLLGGAGFRMDVSLDLGSVQTPAASHLSPYYSLCYIYAKQAGAIPNGAIVMWSGSIASIPAGYQLCTGDGTPDLRDKFVVGKGSVYAVGDEGGSVSHGHYLPNSHGGASTLAGGTGFSNAGTGYVNNVIWSVACTLSVKQNLPAFYALAFIQNISGGSRGSYTGFIVGWSGSIASIPTGWVLCNGTNSPDLRDKFVVGAKQDSGGVAKTNISGSLQQTGGENTQSVGNLHSITFAGSGVLDGPNKAPIPGTGGSVSAIYALGGSGGGAVGASNLPPFYALAFIIKQ